MYNTTICNTMGNTFELAIIFIILVFILKLGVFDYNSLLDSQTALHNNSYRPGLSVYA